MRWRLYIEEYSPELHYIKGEDNDVADALSRLQKEEAPDQTEQLSMELCDEYLPLSMILITIL